MVDTKKVEHLRAIPKADVDRMFDELFAESGLLRGSRLAKKLHGIAYGNTFFTERTIIVKPD